MVAQRGLQFFMDARACFYALAGEPLTEPRPLPGQRQLALTGGNQKVGVHVKCKAERAPGTPPGMRAVPAA